MLDQSEQNQIYLKGMQKNQSITNSQNKLMQLRLKDKYERVNPGEYGSAQDGKSIQSGQYMSEQRVAPPVINTGGVEQLSVKNNLLTHNITIF